MPSARHNVIGLYFPISAAEQILSYLFLVSRRLWKLKPPPLYRMGKEDGEDLSRWAC